MTIKLTASDSRVISFHQYFHNKVKRSPSLYLHTNSTDTITITLPANLLDFANAAAGHSGFGSGARPIGIRLSNVNPKVFRDKVFSSVESTANFLNSSACDAAVYIETVRARHLAKVSKVSKNSVETDDRLAKDFITAKWGFSTIMGLVHKFGRPTVEQARDKLTCNEYELRFGLSA